MRRAAAVLLIFSTTVDARRRSVAPPPLEAVAATLIGGALVSDEPWRELTHLCDNIGHRLTGTPALESAVDWGVSEMAADGLSAWKQPVPVKIWTRGSESLTMEAPMSRELSLLGLGWSVGTDGPLSAEVIVADSFDHLTTLGDAVAGKIVLFDVPFTGYGETVGYRVGGASAAAKLGAVGVLVRSISPESLYTPHTGAMYYTEDTPQIPAAAITLEDAAWIRRLAASGQTISVTLSMGAQDAGEGTSHNAIGEIVGRELPDEVVVLGCHIDSWDVGQGAQDDGGGCVAAMEAGRLIAALPVPPRRSVRVVLYTNEENGLAGAKTYAEEANKRHVAAIESDTGMGAPAGFRLDIRGEDETAVAERIASVEALLAPVSALLRPIGADGLRVAYSGADIAPLVRTGAIGLGVDHDTTDYWPIHHTPADTLDKVDPDNLRRTAAAMAVAAYALAELDY
ncbi:MAG: carboxypeptidase Q [Myxococcota bacterium]